jgi:hypothetical protein
MKVNCVHCHRRPATGENGQCFKCNEFKNACKRCANAEALEGFGRCQKCLNYAANWQREKTSLARKNNQCIICSRKSIHIRCEIHSRKKSELEAVA